MEQEYITSRQNPLMVLTGKLLHTRKHRKTAGLYVCDGTKLLLEATKWAPDRLRTVIAVETLSIPDLPAHVRLVRVPARLMEQISDMEAPEGVLFHMALPELEFGTLHPGTLILDGIQDPGNLGTILRTADAMDVPVLLTEGCVDPYNPKTVRATMGSIFRSQPRQTTRQAILARDGAIPLYVTALSPDAKDIRTMDLREGLVVIGSEGQGVSQRLIDAADNRLIIPMHPRCESLNAAAAAAIVLWQMTSL